MSDHHEADSSAAAQAAAAVLWHWKNVAARARSAELHELADLADHHAGLIENPPPPETA